MKKNSYFNERLERLLKGDIRRSKITQIRIKRGYKRAFQLIEDDIAKYVTRISDDLKLDAKALNKKIPKEELLARAKELKLEEETMANYENLSYTEAIRREMVKNVESMAKENKSLIFENLFKTYEHNYYSTAYLLYRTMDDFSFTKRVTKEYFDWMAKKPWTSDGKTFSDRIWKDQKTLVDELYKEFTVSATRGANLKEAARRMSRKMDVSYKKCLRLLNTEDSFFSNKAVMDAYQNTTAEEYMILATLDRKTCEICGDQDTKHYKIKDAKVGVNMPPFHPNCRCTTVVYFGDEDDMPEERMMRDENGKSVKTEYMSYDEWKKKYVDKIDEIGYNISEKEESNKGLDKDLRINKKLIMSSEYDKKFTKIDNDIDMQRTLKKNAREILLHRDGTKFEDLVYIDSKTNKSLASKHYNEEKRSKATKAMNKLLKNAEEHVIIAIHNHPESSPPSYNDIYGAFKRKYKYGLAVCHNGDIWYYSVNDDLNLIGYRSAYYKLEKSKFNDIEEFIKNSHKSGVKIWKI